MPHAPTASGADPQPSRMPPLDRRHVAPVVLLVDDLEDQRELYGEYLEFAGYEVALARDGYEAIFPDLVREFAARGAQLLVNITNDGWYGRTSAPYQHFAMAKFRAVENERYLVRAANTGITAVVDPRGRVVARTELFEKAVLVRDVPLLARSTFYSRHGDLFAWACLGAAVALLAAGVGNRRRPAKPS